MDRIAAINISSWHESFTQGIQKHALATVESGQVLFLPKLTFTLLDHERKFLAPHYADPKAKNVSLDINTSKLKGALCNELEHLSLQNMLKRYAEYARSLLASLFPHYSSTLKIARTSFRPVEITGRISSYKKDDTRLHVDAFPSSPNQGNRILRVFSNVNFEGKDRLWRLGEPFETVVSKFFPRLRKSLPGSATVLKLFRVTKSYRTLYDHYMLQLHDAMKADLHYQATAQQIRMPFPPDSTWVVFTDCVSHAATAGQFLFEQTFHLPVTSMQNEAFAPVRVLEKFAGRKLI